MSTSARLPSTAASRRVRRWDGGLEEVPRSLVLRERAVVVLAIRVVDVRCQVRVARIACHARCEPRDITIRQAQ